MLAVVAHPDDETFGLGAVVDRLTTSGAAVHLLCYTRGEASTLNARGARLRQARAAELRQASSALRVATVTLLGYPDSRLDRTPQGELAAHVTRLAARYGPSGLLVFDETGITGHPDHRAATRAALQAADVAGLPVLAWTLPAGDPGQGSFVQVIRITPLDGRAAEGTTLRWPGRVPGRGSGKEPHRHLDCWFTVRNTLVRSALSPAVRRHRGILSGRQERASPH